MKHRKKTSKWFRDDPHKSGIHVYKVQYQTIHVTRLPLKDPDNPKAPPQEVRHTEEHVQHVLAADRFAAADYVKALDDGDDHIHINSVTEVAHDVASGSLSKLGHKAVKVKKTKKRRKSHGFNRNSFSGRRDKSKPRTRSAKARKTKAQKAESRKAKGEGEES